MNSTNNYAFTAMEVETRRQLADLPWEVGTARLLVSELDREMTLIVEAFLQSVQTVPQDSRNVPTSQRALPNDL
ncbi:hypothetical protein PF008_g8821 [Phytophthora fragariae]|uniref:Uncharacterized protein n=1 Tax=Phytophthora fragariae TaxID=53985 RepID=A0A6G0RYD3_9STRA|nr:hypothetical protein PF008_g8821 [Phytophthora fragariae]